MNDPARVEKPAAPPSASHNATAPASDAQAITVTYRGTLPDLFREGKGVVAQGALGADGVFRATEVLAKHDENYMPPEAAAALQQAGHPIPSGTVKTP